MGTFNAGAIEAKLTLDRSAFTRELQEARAQAKQFQEDKIKPEIELAGKEKLTELEARLNQLDGKNIDLQVKTDTTGALAEVEALVKKLDGTDIDLPIKVHGEEKLLAVAAVVEGLDGADIDVGFDDGPASGAGRAMQHFTRFEAIVAAVLILLPLIPPVAATATAAVMGLAAAFVAAGGALTAVLVAVAPTALEMKSLNEEIQKQQIRLASLTPGTKEYATQADKIKNLQHEMNTKFGAASAGLGVLQKAWGSFQDKVRPESNLLLGAVFTTLAAILPKLIPIFNATAPILRGMLNSMTTFINSGEGQRMIKFFEDFGSRSLAQILRITGNLIQMFGRLFEAFAPFGTTLLDAIEDVTEAWADWADGIGQTQGFQDFIAYVMQEGPRVWDLIKNLVGALINFGVALAPLGSISLDIFNAIFSFIAEMDPSVLGAIALAIGGAVTGMLLLAAATAVFNAIAGANPIGLIVIAIGALVAAILYLWNNNKTFHDAVVAIWEGIKAGIGAVVDWFTGTVVPAFQTAWGWITGFFQAAWEQIGPIVTGIGEIISLLVQIAIQAFTLWWKVAGPIYGAIWTLVSTTWKNIWAVTSAVLRVIGTIIAAAFGVWKATIGAALGVIAAVWTGVWNTVRAYFIMVINVIKNVLKAVLAAMKGDWSGALNYLRAAASAAWNGIRAVISAAINAIRSVITAGVNGARSVATAAFNGILSVIRSVMSNALGAVRTIIGNIRGAFGGAAGWLVDAGRSIIQGLINGIRNMAGAVGDAVRGVLQKARDLLPFSPAKTGPFSGKGWTLYSGRSMVEALAQGVKDRAGMLHDAMLNTVAGAVPDLGLTPGYAGTGRMGLAPVGGATKIVNVEVNAYNPTEERSSVTAIREITRAAQLGAFDD